MKPTDTQYLTRLDHLRFLAATLVLFWHVYRYNLQVPTAGVPSFPLFSLLQEGHTGVSLFLTLSGYLFWWKLHDKPVIQYWSFIRSRVIRIAPLFLFWTLLYFYIWDVDPIRLLAAVGLLLNKGTVPGNGWTIVVEFQFYMLLPFLIRFSRSYGLRYLFGFLMLMTCVRWSVWLTAGTVQDLSYGTIFGRMDQFLIGMLMSELAIRKPHLFQPRRVLAAASVMLVGTIYAFDLAGGYFDNRGYPSPAPIWIIWPSVEGAVFAFLIASYERSAIQIPAAVDRTFAKLGSYSYSMYLNHHSVLVASFVIASSCGAMPVGFLQVTLFGAVVILPLVCAVSAATFYLIENPFDKLRKPYAAPQTTP